MYHEGHPKNWGWAYLHSLGISPTGARPHISIKKDAPVSEFEKITSKYPVFQIDTI
jgi:hypothetical protein